MDSQVEEVKAKTDIVELIGKSVKLTRAGRNFKGLCPFHQEQTPSFMVSPERGTWRCFGCGESGDAFTFLQKFENLSFPEALEQLATSAGIKLTKRQGNAAQQQTNDRLYQLLQLAAEYYQYILNDHPLGSEARNYVDSRNINQETSKKYNLGYAPNSWQSVTQFLAQKGFKPSEIRQAGMTSQGSTGREFDRFRGRLMFPVSDNVGRIVGFSGRSLVDSKDSPKYLNSPEGPLFHKGRLLFGLAQAREGIRKTGRAVLVEGNIDLLSSYQVGVTEVVAPLGTALTGDQLAMIRKYTSDIILAYDSDKAGVQAVLRSLPLIQGQQLQARIVVLPYGMDPDESIKKGPDTWKKSIDEAIEIFDFMLLHVNRTFDLQTGVGKQKATEQIIPFIEATKDIIEQNFLIHRAADVIGTSDQSIREHIGRGRKEWASSEPPEPTVTIQHASVRLSRSEILTEYLLSTLLTTSPDELTRKELRQIVGELWVEALPSQYQPIWSAIAKASTEEGGRLALNQIGDYIEEDSLPLFERLILTPAESELTNAGTILSVSTRGSVAEQLLQTSIQLNSLHLKSQLSQLTEQLKRASILQPDELKTLKQKFTQITEEYNDYSKKLHE